MSNRFGYVPQVRMNRTKIPMPRDIKTTMNVGRLYPIECIEVLPGDTWKCNTEVVARVSSSFLKPVLDNAYMDVYHFFVPMRLVFEDTEKVFGNPNPSAYVDEELAELPTFDTNENCVSGSVGDYLRLPIGTLPRGISVLPFRAFALIYNEWFRNQNTVPETYVQKGAIVNSERLNSREWGPNNYTGLPPFVSKRNDYFTSALPNPQKGQAVRTSIADFELPVYVKNQNQPLVMTNVNGSNQFGNYGNAVWSLGTPSAGIEAGSTGAVLFNNQTSTIGGYERMTLAPNQLFIDASDVTAVNVNDLRFAFQLQKYLERSARGGSRYREYL